MLSRYLFSKYGWIAVVSIFVFYFAVVLATGLPIESVSNQPIEKLGSLGDSFGALTALFSGLAFWVALYLLREQKEEFSKLVEKSNYGALIQRGQLQPQFEVALRQIGPQADRLEIEFTNLTENFFIRPVLINFWSGAIDPVTDAQNTINFQQSVKFEIRRFDFRMFANRGEAIAATILKFYYIDISTHLVELTLKFSYPNRATSRFINEELSIELVGLALLDINRIDAQRYMEDMRRECIIKSSEY